MRVSSRKSRFSRGLTLAGAIRKKSSRATTQKATQKKSMGQLAPLLYEKLGRGALVHEIGHPAWYYQPSSGHAKALTDADKTTFDTLISIYDPSCEYVVVHVQGSMLATTTYKFNDGEQPELLIPQGDSLEKFTKNMIKINEVLAQQARVRWMIGN